jgi:hypothetical protein
MHSYTHDMIQYVKFKFHRVKVDVNLSWVFLPNERNLGLVCKPCLGLDSLMTKNVPVVFGFYFDLDATLYKLTMCHCMLFMIVFFFLLYKNKVWIEFM